jgi:DNA recombination protein RmuC
MDSMWWIVAFAAGLALGSCAAWLILHARLGRAFAERSALAERDAAVGAERLQAREADALALRSELEAVRKRCGEHESTLVQTRQSLTQATTALEGERRSHTEKLALLNEAKTDLQNAFKALSAEALKTNNTSFLELAKTALESYQTRASGELEARSKAVETLVAPIKESLGKVEMHVQALENARQQAYGALTEQVRSLLTGQERLQLETGNLAKALRAPNVRGRWGEIQLRRVVELAGMVEHCDFVTQELVDTDDGRLRPDMVVRLPGGKQVVIDAKAPLDGYLEALEATDDAARTACLKKHARQVRAHLAKLSVKAYWEQFDDTPEYVVLFLPGEMFFSAALEQDPSLLDDGIQQHVLLATPTNLIAVLKGAASIWREVRIAESAQRISELGSELYDRMRTLAEHFGRLGKELDGAVQAYNQTVASLETRVLPGARKFKELGISGPREIEVLVTVDRATRALQSPEMLDPLPDLEELPEALPGAPAEDESSPRAAG